jgi:hypothetical protein
VEKNGNASRRDDPYVFLSALFTMGMHHQERHDSGGHSHGLPALHPPFLGLFFGGFFISVRFNLPTATWNFARGPAEQAVLRIMRL